MYQQNNQWQVNIGSLVGAENIGKVSFSSPDVEYNPSTGIAALKSANINTITYYYYVQAVKQTDRRMDVTLTLTKDSNDDYGNTFEDAFEWGLEFDENTLDGSLEVSEDVDMFKFIAPASGIYTIYSSDCTGDVYGHLYDSSGKELIRNDDGAGNRNFKMERGLVAGKTYYIKVRNYSTTASKTGSYKLHIIVPVDSDDYGDTFDEAYKWKLEIGDNTLEGNLEIATDEDMFKFTASTTGNYIIYSSDCTGDVYGHLYSSEGKEITRNDDGGDGRNFKIERQLTAGETYFIKIRNYKPTAATTGRYNINIIVPDEFDDYGNTFKDAYELPPHGGEVMLEGNLETSADEDMFKIIILSSGKCTFYSTGCTGDVYGHLYDSNGQEIAKNDDGDEGRNFKIERELKAGTYYIKIRNYKAATSVTGTYTIHFDIPPI